MAKIFFFQSVNLMDIKYYFDTKRNLGLHCTHIAQLMTHIAILHMAVNLVIMLLKPLGILQRVTSNKKMHYISNKKKMEIKNIKL